MNFSKSKYCALWQCPKMAWLNKYKPELREADPSAQARMDRGTEVGELAKKLFGAYEDATVRSSDGSLDLSAMIERTRKLIAEGAETVCEAAFDFGGLYCAVDILHKENGGYAIYEVKSSTGVKYVYLVDVAYQKYVLDKCGVKVSGANVVHIDSSYVREDELDISKLFKISDVAETIADEYAAVESTLAIGEKILACDSEPDTEISENCSKPYGCPYWNYCARNIPKPSVFDLYGMPFERKVELYGMGKISYGDLRGLDELNKNQERQIEYVLEDKGTYIDKDGIAEFLGELHYPLYFLDYETMQLAVPEFCGTRPYAQIPFQYSLHYVEREGGEIVHKEFLAESGADPRRAIAESLCENIPSGACVVAYSKAFECGRTRELAALFPDLSARLYEIADSVVDLIVPFRRGYYYNRAMGGSFSIKSVLPAVFPDDPSLDYHNLEGVHNGGEAMDIFPRIKNMAPTDAEKARRELLEYCKLDTLAMVKIWQELERAVKE